MRRVESFWVPEEPRRIWFLSFEFEEIASMGGLGNAVANLSYHLSHRGKDITVIMPSHGRHLDPSYRQKLNLRDLGIRVEGYRRGVDGRDYRYSLGAEEGDFKGVKIVMVKGLDYESGKHLDSWDIYRDPLEKASLVSRFIPHFVDRSIASGEIPDVINVHDWHMIVPGIIAKQELEYHRIATAVIYTVHLLNKVSLPWHYVGEEWSGLPNVKHYTWNVVRHVLSDYRHIWDRVSYGSLERFGAVESDLLITVSSNYLNGEVLPYSGQWMENKTCVVYNGTDWDKNEVQEWVKTTYGTSDRREARKRILENLDSIKVIPTERDTSRILWENRRNLGIRDDWSLERLGQGPLILFAGRLTYQKGVDFLIRAFRRLLNVHGNARLIILGIPSEDNGTVWDLVSNAQGLRDNLRVVAGFLPDKAMYKAMFYVTSFFVMPSRWEPFGTSAVESMALGTPVVGFGTGGIKETVVDIRFNAEGTGLLAWPESLDDLVSAMQTALSLSLADENNDPSELSRLPYDIREKDTNLWSRVRKNAEARVESMFRWENSAAKLLQCYSKGITMATYRAMSSM